MLQNQHNGSGSAASEPSHRENRPPLDGSGIAHRYRIKRWIRRSYPALFRGLDLNFARKAELQGIVSGEVQPHVVAERLRQIREKHGPRIYDRSKIRRRTAIAVPEEKSPKTQPIPDGLAVIVDSLCRSIHRNLEEARQTLNPLPAADAAVLNEILCRRMRGEA